MEYLDWIVSNDDIMIGMVMIWFSIQIYIYDLNKKYTIMVVFPFSLYLLWYFDGIWTPPSSDCWIITMNYDINDSHLYSLDWLHLRGFDVRSMDMTSGHDSLPFRVFESISPHARAPPSLWCPWTPSRKTFSRTVRRPDSFHRTLAHLNLEGFTHRSFKMAALRF